MGQRVQEIVTNDSRFGPAVPEQAAARHCAALKNDDYNATAITKIRVQYPPDQP